MKVAGLCLVLLLTGCGRVGAPLPPLIRIPERVTDLAVRQEGNDLVLTWTNPARYIDGSEATDLGKIQIRANNVTMMKVDVAGAGKMQTVTLPIGPPLDVSRSFSIIADTTQGRESQVPNAVSISPVAVPGKVSGL